MNTVSMAVVLEMQGRKEEALMIYKDTLKKNPNNVDAKVAIKRLSGVRQEFSGVNQEMKDFFVKMDTGIEFKEFERWLVKWN